MRKIKQKQSMCWSKFWKGSERRKGRPGTRILEFLFLFYITVLLFWNFCRESQELKGETITIYFFFLSRNNLVT